MSSRPLILRALLMPARPPVTIAEKHRRKYWEREVVENRAAVVIWKGRLAWQSLPRRLKAILLGVCALALIAVLVAGFSRSAEGDLQDQAGGRDSGKSSSTTAGSGSDQSKVQGSGAAGEGGSSAMRAVARKRSETDQAALFISLGTLGGIVVVIVVAAVIDDRRRRKIPRF